MLQISSVWAGYGGAPVLRSVDLTVPSGSVAALLGANGAGKSTLLRVASGMLKATSGRVLLDGADITGASVDRCARLGLSHIPEGRSLFPTMTVRDNLLLFSARGTEEASLARAVEAFPRLGERLEQVAGTLSGGEQQMLALARCYVRRPGTILVDEVSLGLAPKVVDEIFEFLAKMVEEGTSLLIVEQYVARALSLADYVYILNRGEITFAGDPAELDENELFKQYVGVEVTR